jgi:aminoglycoside phosphotransferase (APT) family kinase protein
MAREYKVLAALQGSEIPSPEVFGFCDDETIVGAPFYVMSCVHGSVFHRPEDVSGLSSVEAGRISLAVVNVLDQLHRIDPQAVGLHDLGRPGRFVSRRIGRWLEQWRRGPHRDHPQVELLGDRLAAAAPSQADATLVHGDFRLGNMLIAVDQPAPVAALLDWEMSTLGDPLTDLAHLLVYWEPTRGRVTHESQMIARHPGFLTGAELANRYAFVSGRDVSRLDFYLAFEHWRAAIIKEAIFMRASQGLDPAGPGIELGESVDRHLDEAADLLKGTQHGNRR